VIRNAPACASGCTATDVAGSVPKDVHVGLASDGIDHVYYLRANIVWRYTASTGVHELFADSGLLPNGAASNFAFVNGQTNLLHLDRHGNLWIGDDVSDGVTPYYGRIWLIALAAEQAGSPVVQPPPPPAANATLTVKTAGGKGLITSETGLINCGAVCSASLPPGTAIALTVAADPGFTFVNWTGACTGTAPTCVFSVTGKSQAQANFTK